MLSKPIPINIQKNAEVYHTKSLSALTRPKTKSVMRIGYEMEISHRNMLWINLLHVSSCITFNMHHLKNLPHAKTRFIAHGNFVKGTKSPGNSEGLFVAFKPLIHRNTQESPKKPKRKRCNQLVFLA